MSKTLFGFIVFGFVVDDQTKKKIANSDFDVFEKQCEAYGCCCEAFGPSESPNFVIGVKHTLVRLNPSEAVRIRQPRTSVDLQPHLDRLSLGLRFEALRKAAKALGLTVPAAEDMDYFAGIYDG